MGLGDILLDVRLKFETAEDRFWSEDIILRLLGTMARYALHYLLENPQTPLLYESGVRWAPPEQLAKPRVDLARLRELLTLLRAMGASDQDLIFLVRYLKGIEIFRGIAAVLEKMLVDCDNLVIYRLAELWRVGILASPALISAPNDRGGLTYHARIQHPGAPSNDVQDLFIEDPSLLCGMGGIDRLADRHIEEQKNAVRREQFVANTSRLLRAGEASRAEVGLLIERSGFVPRGGWKRAA